MSYWNPQPGDPWYIDDDELLDRITWRQTLCDALADLCGIALAFALVAGWILL